MPKKTRIDMTIETNLLNYIDTHFKLPGNKWSRSDFIEKCIRAKVKSTITQEDHLKNEIKFHEEKRDFHEDIVTEMNIKLKREQGQLKLVPTKVLAELKNNSDRLNTYEDEKEEIVRGILDHAPTNQEVRKDGATVGLNISKGEMRARALQIINS